MAAADSGLSFSSSSSPCPGALIFSSFNLLAGLVYDDCAVRFLSSEKGRNKKTISALVQTQRETLPCSASSTPYLYSKTRLETQTLSPHLLHPIPALPPDEKRPLRPAPSPSTHQKAIKKGCWNISNSLRDQYLRFFAASAFFLRRTLGFS